MSETTPIGIAKPLRCADLLVDPRGYPIIATVPQSPGDIDFGAVSEKRKLALATFDLCAVCAKPFGAELRWQVTMSTDHAVDGLTSSEAPVHEICALYAAQVCPYVGSPYARLGDERRKGQRRPELVVLAGYDRTREVYGAPSGVQDDYVLHFGMRKIQRTHVLRNAADSRSTYVAALEAEQALRLDANEQRLTDMLTRPTPEDGEDSGGVAAGAALTIGAAFCPGVGRVQGLRNYGDTYGQIATTLLKDLGFMDPDDPGRDPFVAAAVRWLASRTEVPGVLAAWRTRGRELMRQAQPGGSSALRRPATRRPDPAQRRKAQRAARRQNRR